MKRQVSGNYYKMRRIYLSFVASLNIPLPVHDFLHFSSDVLGRPLFPLSNTVLVSINFLCHARIDGRDGGSLPYLVLKFR